MHAFGKASGHQYDDLSELFAEIDCGHTTQERFYLLMYSILATSFSRLPRRVVSVRWSHFDFFYKFRDTNLSRDFLATFDYVIRHLTKGQYCGSRAMSITFPLTLDPGLVMLYLKNRMKLSRYEFLHDIRLHLKRFLMQLAPQLGPWYNDSPGVSWLAIRLFFGFDDMTRYIDFTRVRDIRFLDVNSFLEYVSFNLIVFYILFKLMLLFFFIERVERTE